MEVKLLKLGEKVEEATVSFWYYQEGEEVKKDEELLEVVTDKAVFKISAPISGKLIKILVNENEKAKVGEVLGIIEERSI